MGANKKGREDNDDEFRARLDRALVVLVLLIIIASVLIGLSGG